LAAFEVFELLRICNKNILETQSPALKTSLETFEHLASSVSQKKGFARRIFVAQGDESRKTMRIVGRLFLDSPLGSVTREETSDAKDGEQ
jgi:hypothetical protein